MYTHIQNYLGYDKGMCSEATGLVELKPGSSALELLVAKEKEICVHNGQ